MLPVIALIWLLIAIPLGFLAAAVKDLYSYVLKAPKSRPHLIRGSILLIASLVTLYLKLSLCYIPPHSAGIVTQAIALEHQPPGTVIARQGTFGIQPEVLTMGFHWKWYFFYHIEKVPEVYVPSNCVAVIQARAGRMAKNLNRLSTQKWIDFGWLDGEAFLGPLQGEQCIQDRALPPGHYTMNTVLFEPILVDVSERYLRFNEAGEISKDTAEIGMRLDGFEIKVDVRIHYKIELTNAPFVTAQFYDRAVNPRGQGLDSAVDQRVATVVRGLVRTVLSKIPIREIDSKRANYTEEIRQKVTEELAKAGITVTTLELGEIFAGRRENPNDPDRFRFAEFMEKLRKPAQDDIEMANSQRALASLKEKKSVAQEQTEVDLISVRLRNEADKQHTKELSEILGPVLATLHLAFKDAHERGIRFLPDALAIGAGLETLPLDSAKASTNTVLREPTMTRTNRN